MTGLRWRLARMLAPEPIIAAPEGDGAFILARRGQTLLWIRAATLTLNLGAEVPITVFGDPSKRYVPPTRIGTFEGTV